MRTSMILLLALLLAGCGRGTDIINSEKELQPVQISAADSDHIKPKRALAKMAVYIPADVMSIAEEILYRVSGKDMGEIDGKMAKVGNEARASVQVPVGSERKFEIWVYDHGGVETFYGSNTADVFFEQTIKVSVDLARLVGRLKLEGNISPNATSVRVTITAQDIAQPIVREFSAERWASGASIDNIPTGSDRQVFLISYEISEDKITDVGEAVTSVKGGGTTIRIETTRAKSTAEVVGRFP